MKFIDNGKRKVFPNSDKIYSLSNIYKLGFSILTTRILNSDSSKGPLFITWLPTFKCNASCPFCSSNRFREKPEKRLSKKQAIKIAEDIAKIKPISVGFTGGEVLLWPYLFEVIDILKKQDISVYIVTNGILLKEKAEKIVKSNVDYVIVSIDQLNKSHDNMRKSRGILNKALEGIDLIKKLRKDVPLIKTTTIVSKSNISNLKEIMGFLKSKVDIVSLQPIIDGYSRKTKSKLPISDKFIFSKKDESKVRKNLGELLKNNPEFNTPYFKGIADFWFDHTGLINKISCWSPFLRLQIFPNGDVLHCTMNKDMKPVSNLKKASIIEAWNSNEMKNQREIIRRNKNKCICWTQDSSFNAYINKNKVFSLLPILRKR